VCAPRHWLKIALKKARSVDKPVYLASRVSPYRLFLLELLGIGFYERRGDLVVWASVSGGGEVVEVELSEQDWFDVYSARLPRLLALALAEPLRVAVFAAIGLSGVLVNLAVAGMAFGILQALSWVSRPLASTAGFEASLLWNFVLHEKITFKGRGLSARPGAVATRLLKYHFASAVSWISQASSATLLPLLGAPFLLAQFIGIVLGFIANYILGYAYTWSTHLIRGVSSGA